MSGTSYCGVCGVEVPDGPRPEGRRNRCDACPLPGPMLAAVADDLMQEIGEALREPFPNSGPYVEWSAFWNREADPEEFVVEDVLAKGRGHAFWARAEGGKSLLTLWLALQALAAGHVVIYLDWEMTEKDLEDRLTDMGYGPDSDLERLLYSLLPDLPMLDTAAGGDSVAGLVDDAAARFPGRHVVVIIDTIGRAVGGGENDNDTWLNFYRHSGVALKRRGATWLRLDHTGWEGEHSRGASAKYDDVDVVFEVKKTDSGVELHARKRRMPSIPERVVFSMTDNYPLRYERAAQAWPDGTREVARTLDALGVLPSAYTRTAQAALKKAGAGRQNTVIVAAQKYRRWFDAEHSARAESASEALFGATPGSAPGSAQGKPRNHGQEALGKRREALSPAPREAHRFPIREAGAAVPGDRPSGLPDSTDADDLLGGVS